MCVAGAIYTGDAGYGSRLQLNSLLSTQVEVAGPSGLCGHRKRAKWVYEIPSSAASIRVGGRVVPVPDACWVYSEVMITSDSSARVARGRHYQKNRPSRQRLRGLQRLCELAMVFYCT